MNTIDKKQIQRLNERKIELIDEFVSRMEEINYQIKAIQRGEWTIVPREEKESECFSHIRTVLSTFSPYEEIWRSENYVLLKPKN